MVVSGGGGGAVVVQHVCVAEIESHALTRAEVVAANSHHDQTVIC